MINVLVKNFNFYLFLQSGIEKRPKENTHSYELQIVHKKSQHQANF